MGTQTHIFQGMQRDTHPINQKPEFLWEAHNVRITNRDDDTLLSITNEKGNKLVWELPYINEKYVGHCAIDKYIVLFTIADTVMSIYRISKKEDAFEYIQLFSGSGLFTDKPIQTLGLIENDLIMKVYWTDGVTQPKVILITKPELEGITVINGNSYSHLWNGANSFYFVPELNLQETVSVKRDFGDGIFAPGTIQYAFTYYNKYGAQSNIFYTTPVYNISQVNRGGNPEDLMGNIFNIEVNNLDKFEYLRIYSIHRTSQDGTPQVKIVADLSIENKSSIQYTDNGSSQELIDPTVLLYIGGGTIIADCIQYFENTLFLGNISQQTHNIKDVLYAHKDDYGNITSYEHFYNYIGSSDTLEPSTRNVTLPLYYNYDYYSYANQLSENTVTFKYGEWYRIGVQFQYKDGTWSDPVYRGEYTVSNYSTCIYNDEDKTQTLSLPTFKLQICWQASEALIAAGYKKARAVVVLPSFQTRKVLASGILCPTVFTVGDRLRNNPFAQSSWFFRPSFSSSDSNDKYIDQGAGISHSHLSAISAGGSRGSELFGSGTSTGFPKNSTEADQYKYRTNSPHFFVDQSVLTFHSPDVDFNNITNIESYKYHLMLTDLAHFSSNVGDIDITTSSPPIGSMSGVATSKGFFHYSTLSKSGQAFRKLVAGLFYVDAPVRKKREEEDQPYVYYNDVFTTNFLIYPWHKSGSLNNDEVRDVTSGTQSAVLQKKIISNLAFSKSSTSIRGLVPWYHLDKIELFNSEEVSLTKLSAQKGSIFNDYTYFGNIDTLLSGGGTDIFVGKPDTTDGDASPEFNAPSIIKIETRYEGSGDLQLSGKPLAKDLNPSIRMKYKSSPHIVLNLNGADVEKTHYNILPSVNSVGRCQRTGINPFWLEFDSTPTPEAGPIAWYDFSIKYVASSTLPVEIPQYELYKYINQGRLDSVSTNDLAIQIINVGGSIIGLLYRAVNGANNATTWEEVILAGDDIRKTYGYWNKQMSEQNVEIYQPSYLGYSYKNRYYYLKKIDTRTYDVNEQSSSLNQPNISVTNGSGLPYLFIGDIVRDDADIENPFGGNSEEALQNNTWIPAGDPIDLDANQNTHVEFKYGDTWYQRYDCLKTYPFTREDENQIVEIASFMCDTRINIDGRYDRNRGLKSNLSISPQNFNLINKAYSQKDSYFVYRIFDEDFYKNYKNSTQVVWSKEKAFGEEVDTWTNIIQSSSIYLEGRYGKLNAIEVLNDGILAFQDNAINVINFKSRVQVPSSDGVPIEIQNSYKVDGFTKVITELGCQDKSAIINTSKGIYFMDKTRKALILYDGKVNNLSDTLGLRQWIVENDNGPTWTPVDNDYNGIKLLYDGINGDLYLSPGPSTSQKDALCYSEKINTFTSLMSYGGVLGMHINDNSILTLKTVNGKLSLWEQNAGEYNYYYGEYKPFDISFISNGDPLQSKIFDSLEYQADVYDSNGNITNDTFTSIQVDNDYQDSELVECNSRKKFRIWRTQLPRDHKDKTTKGYRNRIVNPWTRIKLQYNKEDSNKMLFHNIIVKYTI